MLSTIKIRGIYLDVYYSIDKERDALGTGDSPAEYDIAIDAIEHTECTGDLTPLLSQQTLDEIDEELIKVYNNA